MRTEDNINVVVAHVRRFQQRTIEGMEDLTRVWAYRLRDEIRRLAPRETGYYASTINVRETKLKGLRQGFEIEVFTDHPAGRRLEKGFFGVDSLGRHYAQPPRPHWRPAEDTIVPKYQAAIKEEIPRWWRR